LGSEDDMPEANYGNVGIALVVLGDARAGLDGGAERNRPGQQTVGVVIVEWPSPEPVPIEQTR